MFRFLGANKTIQEDQSLRNNTSRIASDTSRTNQADTSSSSHGITSRPMLLQQQHQQHNNENMVTLHARLHQEAEKIRKWKVQTEMDIKEKEKKLAEASMRIETLKKSILELQLQNEKTSAKLDEEISNKGEVMKRIDATREMCNLLKSYATDVNDRLIRCETEKTELKYTNKEHLQKYQELTAMFQSLNLKNEENERISKCQANTERLEQSRKIETLKENLEGCQRKIEELSETVRQKDEEIKNLQTQLEEKVSNVATLEISTGKLETVVTSVSKELETRESELKESALRIACVQDEKASLEKKLLELEVNYSNLQASKDNLSLQMTENSSRLKQQLQEAQEEAKATKACLDETQLKLSKCETELSETNNVVENLKTAQDESLLMKKQSELNEDMLKYQISNLLTEKEESKEELHNLNGEISVLQKKLDRESLCKAQVQSEVEELQGKIDAMVLDRQDKEDTIKSLENDVAEMQTKVASFQTLVEEKEEHILSIQNNLYSMEQNNVAYREQIEQLTSQLGDQGQNFEAANATLKEKDEILASTIADVEDLKTQKTALEEKLTISSNQLEELRSKLDSSEEKIQELTNELTELTEQQKESGKNLTTHQKKAAATAKANKELEKEIKTLKTKLDKELKALQKKASELDEVHSEMETLRKAQEEEMKKQEEEMKQLQGQCESDQTKAKAAMKKAEEMQKIAEREKENAKALTDCQLSEMMSTLETYKQNNERLIAEKDLEIESLKAQAKSKKELNTKHEEERAEWNIQLETLKKEKENLESKKEELESKMSTTTLERDQLLDKVNTMENQMSSLKLQKNQLEQAAQNTAQQSNQRAQEKQRTPIIKPMSHQSPPVVQVTPQKQTPQTPVLFTPKVGTVPKTPSRSILRIANSESKRRKVAFANNDDASSSEESDLMEIDPDIAINNKLGTPLLFTPKAEKSKALSAKTATPGTVPLNRKPRGPQVKQTKPREDDLSVLGLPYRSPVFRGTPLELLNKPEPKVSVTAKTPKIRKAPVKKTEPASPENKLTGFSKISHIRKTPAKKSKFFSTSPRNKATYSSSKPKAKDTNEMAWFDIDPVYNFGPED